MKEKQRKKIKNYFLYYFVKITGAIPVLLWLRPKVIYVGGKKPSLKGGTIICANHRSYVDPLLLSYVFFWKKLDTLAMRKMFDTKLKKFFFSRMHCIPVDIDNFSINSIYDLQSDIKSGKNIVVFPEGKINRTDDKPLLEFKSGVVFLASLTNAPIIPTYIAPVNKDSKRRIVLVGEPVHIEDLCERFPNTQQIEDATKALMDRMLELKNLYYNKAESENDYVKK